MLCHINKIIGLFIAVYQKGIYYLEWHFKKVFMVLLNINIICGIKILKRL